MIILITGIDRAENFTLKTWVHMFLIGRPNVGEERSYPILIYQSKNNMEQSEFQTKCTIQKLLYSKGDIQ